MLALSSIRQSKRKELSESPETQRRDNDSYIDRSSGTKVAEVLDIGVSASISPFHRKNLGPWLTDPYKLALWEVLVVWKIDRLVRDMTHFYGELMPELRKLGKHVVAVTEGIDTRTTSEMEIALRISMAQEELKKLTDRAKGSRERLREKARWPGGVPFFGYYSVKTEDGHKLVHDEEAVAALVTVRDLLREGYNPNYAAGILNQEGIPTAWDRHAVRMGRKPKGRIWRRKTLVDMLQARHLMGQVIYHKEPVRGSDGKPLLYGDPIFDRKEWNEIQKLLKKPKKKYRRLGAAMLAGVVFCNACGRTMYHHPGGEKDKRRYNCSERSLPGISTCWASGFPAELLEGIVEEHFLDHYGDHEVLDVRAAPVTDYSVRLTEIAEALDQLEADRYERGRFKGEDGARRFDRIYGKLESERDELLVAQEAPRGLDIRKTGKTYRDLWAEGDREAQGQLLREHGVFVMAQWQKFSPHDDLALAQYVHIEFPLMERATAAAESGK